MEYKHAMAELFDHTVPMTNDGSVDLICLTKMIRILCPGHYILEWVDESKKLYLFAIPDTSSIKQTPKTTEEMVEWVLMYG
jgi:hypothetical protein